MSVALRGAWVHSTTLAVFRFQLQKLHTKKKWVKCLVYRWLCEKSFLHIFRSFCYGSWYHCPSPKTCCLHGRRTRASPFCRGPFIALKHFSAPLLSWHFATEGDESGMPHLCLCSHETSIFFLGHFRERTLCNNFAGQLHVLLSFFQRVFFLLAGTNWKLNLTGADISSPSEEPIHQTVACLRSNFKFWFLKHWTPF